MIERLIRRQGLLIFCLLLWAGGAPELGAQSFRITHFAGSTGGGGYLDGPGSRARFNTPYGAAADSAGNVYVGDASNSVIRKITPDGNVTTLAGLPGPGGFADGMGSAARFSLPQGIATDAAGNVYVADSGNYVIRKVTPDGVVTTIAGSPGVPGSVDGTGSAARFLEPIGIAIDSAGNLYVAETNPDQSLQGNTVRKITPSGTVTTLAGSPTVNGSSDGVGRAALFNFFFEGAVVADAAGNIYVADNGNYVIRKVTPDGVVTTIAGSPGVPGSSDGTGTAALFQGPSGIALDSAGNLYVSDQNTIRRVTTAGVVTTIAGDPNVSGFADGTGPSARFSFVQCIGSDGVNLYLPDDFENNAIRKTVIATAEVTTLAGGNPIKTGLTDGIGTAARFNFPEGLATDGTNLYVSSRVASLRQVVIATGQVTTLTGANLAGLATDGTNVYGANTFFSTIQQIGIASGQVTTLAGTAGVVGSQDGAGVNARFGSPDGIATDGTSLYVADQGNSNIRQIALATGQVTTLAGTAGVTGSTDGVGSAARFNFPRGLATDGTSLYVADTNNLTIRQIVVATGQVTTLAGTAGLYGSTDGVGAAALFGRPEGIATDGTNLYVTDESALRQIVIATGHVTTLAGTVGWRGGTDGTGAGPRFFNPDGIVFVHNAVYIADTDNSNIRQGVCGADDPVTPVIAPLGNPTGPVTGVDYLDVSWSPPASGLTPNSYDWAINGDAFTSTVTTSATAPPRGTNDPITLHVRGRACNPEVAGTAVDSQTSSPAPPVASFTASGPVAPGATVTFTDTSTPQATSWLWLFGDGAFATTQSATHTFSSAGIYTVVLIATNGAGSSETSHPQTVQSISAAPQQIYSTTVFDALNPRRQRLEGVRLAGPGDARLHVVSSETEEAIVYLRLLDDSGRLGKERRLSIAPGQEAVYDLGAYGLRGTWTLELVSGRKFEAFVEGHPSSHGPRNREGEYR
jgi:PKD repeat protein/sugar lactone lactonase YvrE